MTIIIVDGSNLVGDFRHAERMYRLDSGIRALKSKYPEATVIPIVDNGFQGAIGDKDEGVWRKIRNQHGIQRTPQGVRGRGDFLIHELASQQISAGQDVVIVSNDAFRDWHDEYPWITDPGRIIGHSYIKALKQWTFIERGDIVGEANRRSSRGSTNPQDAQGTHPGPPAHPQPPVASGGEGERSTGPKPGNKSRPHRRYTPEPRPSGDTASSDIVSPVPGPPPIRDRDTSATSASSTIPCPVNWEPNRSAPAPLPEIPVFTATLPPARNAGDSEELDDLCAIFVASVKQWGVAPSTFPLFYRTFSRWDGRTMAKPLGVQVSGWSLDNPTGISFTSEGSLDIGVRDNLMGASGHWSGSVTASTALLVTTDGHVIRLVQDSDISGARPTRPAQPLSATSRIDHRHTGRGGTWSLVVDHVRGALTQLGR